MAALIARLRRLRIFHLPSDGWEAVHMAASGLMAWASFVLIQPVETFASSPAYASMAALAPERVWAGFFAIMALIGWWGLESHSRKATWVSCIALVTGHSLILVCIAVSAGFAFLTGACGFFALLAFGRAIAEADKRP